MPIDSSQLTFSVVDIASSKSLIVHYLTKAQGKSQEEAEEIVQKVHEFIKPRLSELYSHEPHLYFSTQNKGILPRTIHIVPDHDLILICLNKKRNEPQKMDKLLGKGSSKFVYEAIDCTTGKVYARVMRFSDVEKQCAELLKDIPGIAKTYAVDEYESAKSGQIKMVAIQEKIEGPVLVKLDSACGNDSGTFMDGILVPAKLTLQQKIDAVKTLLDTLDQIHSRGVTHEDLHPENIRFDADFQAKIIDFDLAKVHPQGVTHTDRRKDMERVAGIIHVLCYGIMDTALGKNFIESVHSNEMSAKEAHRAFDEMLKIPGISETFQKPLPTTVEELFQVLLRK